MAYPVKDAVIAFKTSYPPGGSPSTNTLIAPLEIDLGLSDMEVVTGKTLILYGDSGLGKSTQLYTAAEWLHYKNQKPVRLISAEDSSKSIFEPLIRTGKVEAVFITKSANPVSTLRKLSRGDWYNAKLKEWLPYNGNVCAYIIEGLTSIAESIQEDCRDKNRFLGEQKEQAVVENGETLALPGKFSYNFTQLEMIRLLKGFAMIPNIVRVLWSSHETKGVEDGSNVQLRGPAIVGSAKTGSVQKYCGALLHLDGISTVSGTGDAKVVVIKRRVWFDRHPDSLMPLIQYPAKITMSPYATMTFRKKFPNGYFDSEMQGDQLVPSLADFLKYEDKATSEAIKHLESQSMNKEEVK